MRVQKCLPVVVTLCHSNVGPNVLFETLETLSKDIKVSVKHYQDHTDTRTSVMAGWVAGRMVCEAFSVYVRV